MHSRGVPAGGVAVEVYSRVESWRSDQRFYLHLPSGIPMASGLYLVANMPAVLHFEASEAEKLATREIISEQYRG
jgi:hypothetical protein